MNLFKKEKPALEPDNEPLKQNFAIYGQHWRTRINGVQIDSELSVKTKRKKIIVTAIFKKDVFEIYQKLHSSKEKVVVTIDDVSENIYVIRRICTLDYISFEATDLKPVQIILQFKEYIDINKID